MWEGSTLISGVVWWGISVCGWSVVGSMWCFVAGLMTVISVCRMWALWDASGVVVIVPVSWPRASSIWARMTWAAMSVKMWLWPGMTLPVPVFTVVSETWPGMVGFVWSGLMVLCLGSQRRYPVWTVHDNVTVLITLEIPNDGAFSCYMSLFLALETVIFLVWHHVDCKWWSNHGVSCCTALSFSILHIALLNICGPFSYMWLARLWAFFSPEWISWWLHHL